MLALYRCCCRANLHVVLCLSAVGEAFRERCRLFPGLVNCTTIDWYTEWPADALYEAASRQMASENLGTEEIKQAVCKASASLRLGCLVGLGGP
jgi:dynein heavy chain